MASLLHSNVLSPQKNKKERKEKKKLYLGHLGFLTRTDVAVCGCAPVMEVSLAW